MLEGIKSRMSLECHLNYTHTATNASLFDPARQMISVKVEHSALLVSFDENRKCLEKTIYLNKMT